MKNLRALSFFSMCAALAASSAAAHHSFAMFDRTTSIEIRGVVVDFKLRNPHSSFVVDGVAFGDGVRLSPAPERWEIEADASAPMRTTGIESDTFEPGDTITVVAHPHQEPGFRFAKATRLRTADGAEYVLGFRGSNRLFDPALRRALQLDADAAAAPGSGTAQIERITGRWQLSVQRFGSGPALALNERGMAAWRAYDPQQSPANTCEPINVPELYNAPFFLVDVRLEKRRAVFRYELYDVVRTIPLNGASGPASVDGGFGTVVGAIDGDTLVVESRGYPPSRWGLAIATQLGGGADVPSSEQKTVTERYSVSADGRTLVVDYTLSDPAYLSAPYHGRVELTRVPDGTPMYPYDCDPESAAMWSRTAGDAPLRIGVE